MAQILVQRKRKSYWWVWLLLLVIILGVLFYLYTQGMLGDLKMNSSSGSSSTQVAPNH